MATRTAGWVLAAACAGTGALMAPPSAGAATLVVPPCSPALPSTETVAVQGTGFAPGRTVRLTADGRAFGSATTDAAGAFRDAFLAPPFSSPRRMVQTLDLAATDDAGTGAATPLRVTRVSATLPDRAPPSSRVRMRVFGFRPGRTVYLHVRRAGRTRGTLRIGTATAPCGLASRRLRYMPLRRWSTGIYAYEFQQSRRFRPDLAPVQLNISIARPAGRR